MRDSFLVDGVAFKKTFSYAGFEMQPRSFEAPKVRLRPRRSPPAPAGAPAKVLVAYICIHNYAGTTNGRVVQFEIPLFLGLMECWAVN